MSEKNKKPEVRFAGYTDEWDEKELGQILEERKILQKISDDAPILAFAAGQGVIDRSERRSNNRDHLTLDQANKIYKLTEFNDIVYNPSNLKYGAIDRNKHGRGVISPIYVTFTTEEEPSFIELIVKSEKFKLRALQYEEGTVVKRQSVKPENLLSLKVSISPSLDEQKKIGVLFEHLEKLITLHQEEYGKLVNLKKAMLEKMFAKENNDIPEIRFKGFSGFWEPIDFTSIVTRVSSKGEKTGLPRVEYEDIISDRGELNKNVFQKKSSKTGIEFDQGDILFGKLRPYLRNWFLSPFKGIAVGDFWVLRAKERDSRFVYYLIQTPAFEKIANQSSGSKMPRSDWSLVSKTKFRIPVDRNEQTQIGELLYYLDKMITLNQNEIEKLYSIKKACFEKMTSIMSDKKV